MLPRVEYHAFKQRKNTTGDHTIDETGAIANLAPLNTTTARGTLARASRFEPPMPVGPGQRTLWNPLGASGAYLAPRVGGPFGSKRVSRNIFGSSTNSKLEAEIQMGAPSKMPYGHPSEPWRSLAPSHARCTRGRSRLPCTLAESDGTSARRRRVFLGCAPRRY